MIRVLCRVGGGEVVEQKVFISWLYLCTAFNTTTNQRRGDLPRSTGSFNPVSAIKLTVAWNLYAPLSGSITIPSSPLRCASIPSKTLSRLNQKLSCDTVLKKRSLVSLVIAWMAYNRGTRRWEVSLSKIANGPHKGRVLSRVGSHINRKFLTW